MISTNEHNSITSLTSRSQNASREETRIKKLFRTFKAIKNALFSSFKWVKQMRKQMTTKQALIDSMVLVATASNTKDRNKAQELVDHFLQAYESENIQNVIKESEKRLHEFINQTLQTN